MQLLVQGELWASKHIRQYKFQKYTSVQDTSKPQVDAMHRACPDLREVEPLDLKKRTHASPCMCIHELLMGVLPESPTWVLANVAVQVWSSVSSPAEKTWMPHVPVWYPIHLTLPLPVSAVLDESTPEASCERTTLFEFAGVVVLEGTSFVV